MEMSSKFLQSSTLTAEEAFDCIDRLHIHLHNLLSDQKFDRIYENVKNLVNNDYYEPQPFKPKRKQPAANSDFLIHSQFPITNIKKETLSGKNKLKQTFFEYIDIIRYCV